MKARLVIKGCPRIADIELASRAIRPVTSRVLIDTHDFLRDETLVTVEADVARLQAWFREVYASSTCRPPTRS